MFNKSKTQWFEIDCNVFYSWWWCYPTPSEGWGRGRTPRRPNSRDTPPRTGPEIKNGRSSAKDGAPERHRYVTIQEEVSQILQRVSAGTARIIFLPFYPAEVRGQEKDVTMAAKSGQFIADKMGKSQLLRGNRRNLAGVVRKISSPKRVASMSNLCNGWCQWARNMNKGECCSGFGERVCPFISGKSSMTGDPLEAKSYTGGEGAGKIQVSQKSFGWETLGP